MFFHWDLLNERVKEVYPRRGDATGLFVVRLKDPQRAAEVASAIDATFKNSLAETLSETEKAFQLSFVAMTEAILLAIQAVSFVVVVIIMAVMANTMAMTALRAWRRSTRPQGAGLFQRLRRLPDPRRVAGDRALGGLRACCSRSRWRAAFADAMGSLFPIFFVSDETVLMQIAPRSWSASSRRRYRRGESRGSPSSTAWRA